ITTVGSLGGRSSPRVVFESAVTPQPDVARTATCARSATAMSSARRAMTADFPARYTLMTSFVVTFGIFSLLEVSAPQRHSFVPCGGTPARRRGASRRDRAGRGEALRGGRRRNRGLTARTNLEARTR